MYNPCRITANRYKRHHARGRTQLWSPAVKAFNRKLARAIGRRVNTNIYLTGSLCACVAVCISVSLCLCTCVCLCLPVPVFLPSLSHSLSYIQL